MILRKISISLIFGGIIAASMLISVAFSQDIAQGETVGNEEYEVYSCVLKNGLTPTKSIIVRDTTEENKARFTSSIVTELEEKSKIKIEKELKVQYIELNQRPVSLENKFNKELNVHLISKEELNDIYQNKFGWYTFRKMYPGACHVTLSRVAFNKTGDMALVYVDIMFGILAGAGDHFLLKKKYGVWTVYSKINEWRI